MKIYTNYDLINEIVEAKNKLNLQVVEKRGLACVALADLVLLPQFMQCGAGIGTSLMITSDMLALAIITGAEYLVSNILDIQNHANENLYNLVQNLKKLNIETTEDLLKQSYKYKTEYKLKRKNSNVKILIQKKYINIPTFEKEESVLQEHEIGSLDYCLSRGYPKKEKVFKLSYNPI